MKHTMALDNARTGNRYALELTATPGGWEATWRTLDGSGAEVSSGPSGRLEGADPERLFDAVRAALEELDEDIVGVDWSFDAPLPPWLEG